MGEKLEKKEMHRVGKSERLRWYGQEQKRLHFQVGVEDVAFLGTKPPRVTFPSSVVGRHQGYPGGCLIHSSFAWSIWGTHNQMVFPPSGWPTHPYRNRNKEQESYISIKKTEELCFLDVEYMSSNLEGLLESVCSATSSCFDFGDPW